MELSLPWDPVFYSAVSMRAATNSILTRTSHDTGSSDHNGLSVVSLGAMDIEENGFDMEYIRWGKRKGGERREKDVVDDRERCSVNNTIILIIKYMQY